MASQENARIESECENENCILLDDVVTKISENIPITEWSRLEIVSKQFQRCVQNAYYAQRTLDLKTIFLAEFGSHKQRKNDQVYDQILSKLVKRCPLLQTISGFDCLLDEMQPPHLVLLSELTELKNVDFENVCVGIDDLKSFWKNFPQTKSVTIDAGMVAVNDKVNDAHFDFLEYFNGLLELTISGITSCTGSFLSMVNAEHLKVLNFTGSTFKGSYIGDLLKRSANLETLHVIDPVSCLACDDGFDLELFQCLPNLMKLRKFDLKIDYNFAPCHRNKRLLKYNSDDLLNVLLKCKSLREVRLQNGYRIKLFSDNLLNGLIAECPHLEALDFCLLNCVSEGIVSNITYLQNLTHLVLRSGYYVQIALNGLCSNLYRLNNLSHLTLCSLKEAELMSLKCTKNLTHFICNGEITEMVVKNWIEVGFLKNLTYLELFVSIPSLYDFFIIPMSEDEIVKPIAENAPNLKTLIVWHSLINDETLLVIGECCKRLEIFHIKYSDGITEEGVLKLLLNCDSLRCLNIHGCPLFHFVVSNVLFQPFKHVICLPIRLLIE